MMVDPEMFRMIARCRRGARTDPHAAVHDEVDVAVRIDIHRRRGDRQRGDHSRECGRDRGARKFSVRRTEYRIVDDRRVTDAQGVGSIGSSVDTRDSGVGRHHESPDSKIRQDHVADQTDFLLNLHAPIML